MRSYVQRKFRFPEREEDVKQVHNMYHLIDVLRQKQREFAKFKLQNIFKVRHEKTQRVDVIHSNCQNCSAKLTHQRVNIGKTKHYYALRIFDPAHRHQINRNELFKELFDYVKSNYKDEKVSDNMMIFSAQAKFGDHFNSEEYREIVLKVRKSGTIKPLIKELQNFGSQNFLSIHCAPTSAKKLPTFLLLSSYKMKANYLAYGRFIYIHRIPYIISKSEEVDKWYVTVLSGRNKKNRIVFYALAITTDYNSIIVNEILKQFLVHMKVNIFEVIITQKQKYYIEGITLFRNQTGFIGQHLWDLLFQIKEELEWKKKVYRKMLRSTQKQQYNSVVEEQRKVLKDIGALNFSLMESQSQKYCLTAIKPVFVGLGVLSSHFPRILQKIVKQFPSEQPYTHIVFKFFTFLEQAEIYDFPIYAYPQKEPIYPPLQKCYEKLSSNVISVMYHHFRKVINLNIISRVYDKQNIVMEIQCPQEIRIIKQDRFEREWIKCDCFIRQKTGLPCSHIMKVCLDEDIELYSQIDQFWIKDPPTVEQVSKINKQITEQQHYGKEIQL